MSKKMNQHRGATDDILVTNRVVRARDAIRSGMDGCDIRRLVRRGRFLRLAPGIYRNTHLSQSDEEDQLVAALRAPNAAFCLESAFYWHGLLDAKPETIWLGLRAKGRRPKINDLAVRFVWLTGAFDRLPVETWEFDRVRITTLDPAAAVAHALARRDLISKDVTIAALRTLVEEDPIQELRVVRFAARCRVLDIVWPHLPRQRVADDAVCSLLERYDAPPPLAATESDTTVPPTTLPPDDVYWPAA